MGNGINFAPALIITGSGAEPQSRSAKSKIFGRLSFESFESSSIWPLFVPNSPCGRLLLTFNRGGGDLFLRKQNSGSDCGPFLSVRKSSNK